MSKSKSVSTHHDQTAVSIIGSTTAGAHSDRKPLSRSARGNYPIALLAQVLSSALLFLVAPAIGFSADKTDTWVSTPTALVLSATQKLQWVDEDNAVVFGSHVNDVIDTTMGSCKGYAPVGGGIEVTVHSCSAAIDSTGKPTGKAELPNFPGPHDYVIIHVVRWKALVPGKSVQDVDKQNWYIATGAKPWDDADYSGNNRIFGSKNVYLLYIQFGKDTTVSYSMRYDLKTSSKIPAFIDNLIQLGQIAGIGTAGGGAGTPTDVWGANGFSIPYVPSDIQITPTVIPAADASIQLDAKKFDNEGKYHIDFSVGVPITKISDVSYTSTSGTLVPTSVSTTSIFALFNYYPWAVDVKSPWSKYPHLLTGVSLASQPLHQTLYAIGYGPAVANLYGGALLNVKQLPKVGGSCSATPSSSQAESGLSKHYCAEFSFGLNVSVGVIAQSLKSNKSGK